MSAQTLPEQSEAGAPEWVHLLPAGEIATDDQRGPYHVKNPDAVIAASFQHTERLPVDVNHSTHKLGAKGYEAPAVGWVTEMQSRADGIWGRVEWTERGEKMVAGREYRGISPVIRHDQAKDIMAISVVSLTNKPNLRGMNALHTKEETDMNMLDKLIEMLGLAATATEEEVMAAVGKKLKGMTDAPAMQTAMGQVSVALGLAEDADPDDIVTAAQTAQTAILGDGVKDGLITELQSSVKMLDEKLTALQKAQSAKASEAFYEAALAEKRAGVGPNSKADLISLHQSDPDAAEAFVASMPKLGMTATTLEPPKSKDGKIALNSSDRDVAKQMGFSHEEFANEREALNNEEVA